MEEGNFTFSLGLKSSFSINNDAETEVTVASGRSKETIGLSFGIRDETSPTQVPPTAAAKSTQSTSTLANTSPRAVPRVQAIFSG
mmetsp:Transcript_75108/g.176339  ORF Transcript_75108/g.176339 Transcript_75108/m.176339 type:complete len:85 (-) Transcript_75108:42-296(-)